MYNSNPNTCIYIYIIYQVRNLHLTPPCPPAPLPYHIISYNVIRISITITTHNKLLKHSHTQQQAIQASRRCPLHQDPTQANPIGSRPEDFLATDAQKKVCDEVLVRSFACNWEDVPGSCAASVAAGGGAAGTQKTTTAATGTGIAARAGAGAGTVVSGYEPAASSSASSSSALHAAPDRMYAPSSNMFDRETTPQTIHDVMRLQTVLGMTGSRALCSEET